MLRMKTIHMKQIIRDRWISRKMADDLNGRAKGTCLCVTPARAWQLRKQQSTEAFHIPSSDIVSSVASGGRIF